MSPLKKSEKEHRLHIYRRVKHSSGRKDIFMCAHPYCTHVTSVEYLLGKAAECPYCGREYIMRAKQFKREVLLHCPNCRSGRGKRKNVEEIRKPPKPETNINTQITERLEDKLKRILGD